ncbi:hypothetical protein K461DRAFT_229140 [Myriangium duriaei CBS 260.36]|uniref:T6SS Phospholipase effector Tle1-like catalytic domain-containing protein n=1 Tax=Myriangium duriaei CBS 260.36 TaxID=1168546 RepID=A0A9P4IZR5_9PEZI|nr:hypothetical protein K461DRAFT_229140 [Myriangium duriaei CBS 260.36]
MASPSDQDQPKKRRLVLCFDGTGNKFLGNESDTNIIKIYERLNREDGDQFHYYQPGIGTYVEHQSSNSSTGNLWTRIKSKIITTVDQAVGTSFVHHVLAGYRFIMRYYTEGDLIYIFGFSRGAYTARFLSEMLFSIGLLSRGNEEMVRFAWDTFSDYQRSRGNVPQTTKDKAHKVYMDKFKKTFCRPEVEVYFLGLFDCVNSVGQFEVPFFSKSFDSVATPPAKYIRHAISIHERRLKFKPALFLMDDAEPCPGVDLQRSQIKEVWFAGNHADVGGGWPLNKNQRHLLSDTPLEWMLQELKTLPKHEQLDLTSPPIVEDEMRPTEYDTWFFGLFRKHREPDYKSRVKTQQPHDMLAFGRGVGFMAVLNWWIFEVLPFFTRLELEDGKWIPRTWPPNLGTPRDIPLHATIHPSVGAMFRAGVLSIHQMPKLGGTDGPAILLPLSTMAAWGRQRDAREKRAADAKLQQQQQQKDAKAGKVQTNNARAWDNLGYTGAKSWAWD